MQIEHCTKFRIYTGNFTGIFIFNGNFLLWLEITYFSEMKRKFLLYQCWSDVKNENVPPKTNEHAPFSLEKKMKNILVKFCILCFFR